MPLVVNTEELKGQLNFEYQMMETPTYLRSHRDNKATLHAIFCLEGWYERE